MSERSDQMSRAREAFEASWEAKGSRPSLDKYRVQVVLSQDRLTTRAIRIKLKATEGRVRGGVENPPTLP